MEWLGSMTLTATLVLLSAAVLAFGSEANMADRNPALPEFRRMTEPEAVRKFDLAKRLDMFKFLAEPLDPRNVVLVHDGDLHVRGSLDLDGGMLRCPNDDQPRCGLVVTGNLTLDTSLLNAPDTAWGVFLVVLGDTRAWAIHAGGAEIVLLGKVYLEDAAVASGVKGSLAMGSLDAPVLIKYEHWVKLEAGNYLEANLGGYSSTRVRCWSQLLDPSIPVTLENDPEAADCYDRGETVDLKTLMLRMRQRESILKPERRRPGTVSRKSGSR